MIHAMNKDKYVTNSAKCMKLVNQNLGAAKLLEQIMYWARYTKHEDDLGNRIVCFTHDEWAEITGMTISQVKYGLRKLREMRLVTTKNAPHLYKSGKLRTVHIYISEDLYDQYYADQNMAKSKKKVNGTPKYLKHIDSKYEEEDEIFETKIQL